VGASSRPTRRADMTAEIRMAESSPFFPQPGTQAVSSGKTSCT
jgi:hypothetical protein